MMKKLTCFMIVFCLALMLTACGGKTDSGESTQAAPAEAESEAEQEVDASESVAAESETEDSSNAAETRPAADESEDSVENQVQTDGAAAETESDTDTSETAETAEAEESAESAEPAAKAKLLYMGHSSIRITTPEGKVIYIDPYVGDGYEPAADLILVTHGHYDHYDMDKVANRNPDCRIITWQEALADGAHQTFDLDFANVEAVEAGNNQYHNISECVGYIVTLTDGTSVYVTGDTSTTEQMSSLAEKEIDYAFFCCDGVYNMGLEEAAKCAETVKAKHNIPYHMVPADSGIVFDRSVAEQFHAPDALIIEDGQEIELE